MATGTFHLISLGCAKNTVDSDSMAQLLLRDGYRMSSDPGRANVLIVNTCGFIREAVEESIDEILAASSNSESAASVLPSPSRACPIKM